MQYYIRLFPGEKIYFSTVFSFAPVKIYYNINTITIMINFIIFHKKEALNKYLSLVKSTDITFIVNGPVAFESIKKKQRNIHLFVYFFLQLHNLFYLTTI